MGAIFVGVLIGAALWGISCMQTYEYFSEFSRDSWSTKTMVGTLFCLDTLHQVFMTHVIYTYLITEHFNAAYLNEVVWTLLAQVFVSAIIGFIVQSFFVYRIWILSRHNIFISIGVMLLVLAELALSLTYFVKGLKVTTFTLLPTLFQLSQSVNALAATGDIAIAMTLIFLLYRSKTGFSKSDSIVNQLILYSLNTGFLTSICALLSLISITVYPTTFIFITFYTPLGRLYTNSLLATLNARKKLRNRVGTSHNSIGSSQVTADSRNKTDTSSFSVAPNPALSRHLAIRVDTETAKGYDPSFSQGNKFELSVFGDQDHGKSPEHAV